MGLSNIKNNFRRFLLILLALVFFILLSLLGWFFLRYSLTEKENSESAGNNYELVYQYRTRDQNNLYSLFAIAVAPSAEKASLKILTDNIFSPEYPDPTDSVTIYVFKESSANLLQLQESMLINPQSHICANPDLKMNFIGTYLRNSRQDMFWKPTKEKPYCS